MKKLKSIVEKKFSSKKKNKEKVMDFHSRLSQLKRFQLDEFERPSSRINSQKSNNNVHIIIDPVLKKLDIPPVCRDINKTFLD